MSNCRRFWPLHEKLTNASHLVSPLLNPRIKVVTVDFIFWIPGFGLRIIWYAIKIPTAAKTSKTTTIFSSLKPVSLSAKTLLLTWPIDTGKLNATHAKMHPQLFEKFRFSQFYSRVKSKNSLIWSPPASSEHSPRPESESHKALSTSNSHSDIFSNE